MPLGPGGGDLRNLPAAGTVKDVSEKPGKSMKVENCSNELGSSTRKVEELSKTRVLKSVKESTISVPNKNRICKLGKPR